MAQHGAKGARFQAVTANRLGDGEAVYFTADGTWTERFSEAAIADGADAAAALLARATPPDVEMHVIEPYLFEVVEADTPDFAPLSVREIIRAEGPSIRRDLGKQATA